jgi:hypothetical protein
VPPIYGRPTNVIRCPLCDEAPETREPLDADAIYRQIGLFVVAFQSLESELMQICWLLSDPPYAPDGRKALAKLSFSELLGETRNRVDGLVARRGLDDSQFRRDFLRTFQELLAHCRSIARHRNKIVHSAYVHLEGGGDLLGIVRSDMTRAADRNDVDFDRELLTATSFDAALKDLAWTGFRLGQSKMQLIAWIR